MINGLSKIELEIINKEVLEPLKSMDVRVWVFGSRARNDFKKYSDIDLLFELDENSTIPAGFIYDIELRLEESNLPYKVELVNIDKIAESYRDSIMKDRIAL